MRLFQYVLLAACLIASPTAARTPSPIMVHYRAYAAALERGDLAVAETEAEAALAASEARDGDGGRTAVLALNLAQVRLDLGRPGDALAPAQRAFTLSEERGAAADIDPLMARLFLGRAELSRRGAAGRERLEPALAEAAGVAQLWGHGYEAAAALAHWTMRENHLPVARAAWSSAIAFSQGDEPASVAARATALVGRGAVLTLMDDFGSRDHPELGTYSEPCTRETVRFVPVVFRISG